MANPRILIVDDEPFNVDYLTQELEESNCETNAAYSGKEALEIVQAWEPDLILLDIMMPGMDGYEVLARLKSNPAARDIPVIIISAESGISSVVRGIQLGAEDYLPKPFEPTLLHARVGSSLEKKRLLDLQKQYLHGLERELDIAREIQMGFLPAELPAAGGWEIASYFKAAREVAGDFYDAFLLPDGSLAAIVGDVCGKGVGAALFMTLVRSLLRATATGGLTGNTLELDALPPADRLRHVITFTNNYIAETHGDTGMFTTVFFGIFGKQNGLLTYVNCGNEPPLVIQKDGNISALRPTGPVIGVIPEAEFLVQEIQLEKGDLLIAYTDGVPDSQSVEGDFFGAAQLADLVCEHPGSAAEILTNIESELHRFTRGAAQFDDITLLAVRRTD
jgi:serine phosphatase RsbU (regulator of sigma subunit)